jgi:hypothetical protein
MTNDEGDVMTLCLRKHGLDWCQIDDEIVALDGQEAVYLAVEGSGALVWRLLAETATRDTLIEALVLTYGIDATRAAADVDAFLATLNERELLVTS